MATVRMRLGEAIDGDFPATCLQCGQPAEHWVTRRFSWYPSWVWILLLAGLIPFAIVASILTKRATLRAPLCGAHRNHWFKRTCISVGGLVGIIALLVLWVTLMGSQARTRETWGAVVGWSVLVGVFAWVIAIIALNTTAIRPQEITDTRLLLQGVSDQFVDDLDRFLDERDRDEPRERRRPDRRPSAHHDAYSDEAFRPSGD